MFLDSINKPNAFLTIIFCKKLSMISIFFQHFWHLSQFCPVSSSFFQFCPDKTGRNRFLPLFSVCPGRNRFLPEETQPWLTCCLTSPLFSILGLLPTLWCPISHSNNLWTLLCSHRVNWPTACQLPWGALSHHLQTRALLPAAGSPPPRPHRHSLLWQARRSMAIPGPAPWRKPWTEQVMPTVNLMPTPLWQLLHSQSVVEIVNQMPTLLQHLLNTPWNQSQPSSHRVKWTIIL